MADLDRFFAKKDKKKVKGKKFTTTDEIAKRLEDSEKKLEKEFTKVIETPKKVEETIEETAEPGEAPPKKKTQPVKEQQPPRKEEEEWKDFADESSHDYSDLKITKLQIEDEEEGGGSGEDDNESSDKDEKKDGVWKKETQQTQQQVTGPAPVPDEKETTPTPANTSSSYVPPHLRNAAPTQSRPAARRNRQAPDITNEAAFPSLSNALATNPMGAWGKKKSSDDRGGFENVKHGSTRTSHEGFSGPRLSVANRFDALSDNS